MVARDHDDLDASRLGDADRVKDRSTRRIAKCNEAVKAKIALDNLRLLGEVAERVRGDVAVRKAEDAEPFRGHCHDLALGFAHVVRGDGALAVLVADAATQRQYAVCGAFGRNVSERMSVAPVRKDDGHTLAVRVEGDLEELLEPALGDPDASACVELACGDLEGGLRRIAGHLPRVFLAVEVDCCVRAEGADFERLDQIRMALRLGDLDVADEKVALGLQSGARDGERGDRGREHLCSHAPLRESAGFVRADHGHRAQSLERGHCFDDDELLGAAADAEGQRDRDDGHEAFGDDGDSESDADLEPALQIRTLDGAGFDADADEPDSYDDGAKNEREPHKHFSEAPELLHERRDLGRVPGESRRDGSDLRREPGANNHALADAFCHDAGHERHVLAIADGEHAHGVVSDALVNLLHGQILARELLLVDIETHRNKEAQIRGDHGALVEGNDVAGDKRARVDLDALAVSQHNRLCRSEAVERG
eukprot:Amastigsp_a683_8.p2 type:complete len:482 gc:universal Amastigsp_a683_8:2130-685(-)